MVVQNEMWWSVLSAVATCASVGLILRVSSKCRSERCKHSDDKKEWSTRTVVLALMGAPAAWILITKPDSLPLLFLFGGSTLIGLGVWDWILKYIFYAISPVAYPGEPRKNKLTRLAEFPDREHEFVSTWKFLSAHESHTHTTQAGGTLTGEPAGRHIWVREPGSSMSTSSQSEKKSPVRWSSRIVGENNSNHQTFSFNPSRNPNSSDMPIRQQKISAWTGKMPDEDFIPKTPKESARKGIEYYQMLQCDDGHWSGDYGGPMFLMPGLIITYHAMRLKFEEGRAEAMVHYMRVHQQVDGGWGSHIEGASNMFGSVLNYVAMRLLGVPADDEAMVKGRKFIHQYGGALYTASWSKFYLAILGVYEWEGINPVPPELWNLPLWTPFHPGRTWCHCRMVYLPMSYVYGLQWRYKGDKDPVICDLKNEIYIEPYESIDWDAHRNSCADIDRYSPVYFVMKALQTSLKWYERWLLPFWPLTWLRRKGIEFAMEYMHAEDKQTNYIDIGPVNKTLNMLCTYINGGESESDATFQLHKSRIPDYLWVAEDGMKMNGYNGSQCWDTSFAIQAIIEGGFGLEFPGLCKKVWRYLNSTQIHDDEEQCNRFYRHISKGGWPFSTSAHGWPISDCTGEGLKGVLALDSTCRSILKKEPTISLERLKDCVNVIFSLQNDDGGWATYENNRGFGWYENLNPSEVFGNIMIDYSYVECTSACMTALASFMKSYPDVLNGAIKRRLAHGSRFLKSIQRVDGSWYGSWAFCFTYGTWFGITGLRAAGEATDSVAIMNAVSFLLSRQNSNGGWGESHLSAYNKSYGNGTASLKGGIDPGNEGSGIVQTAWACLGLMESGQAECETGVMLSLNAGIRYLMSMQLPSGDWKQENITGSFNHTIGITYSQYRNIFPIWALGRYSVMFPA